MQITKRQAKLYKVLKKKWLQQLLLGLSVLMIVWLHFMYQAILNEFPMSKDSVEMVKRLGFFFQEPLYLDEDGALKLFIISIWPFWEALFYTLVMGVPVYFNLNFIYRGKIQLYLEETGILTKAQIRGWRFYLFLLFSCLTALIFFFPIYLLFDKFLLVIHIELFQNFLIILLLIFCTTGVNFTKDDIEKTRLYERRERQEEIRRRKLLEQELQFIKKQIRPHFLFNTLANLQILAKQKSDVLPDLMGRLSNLLRYLLYETNASFVPLASELDFLKSYLELEKLQLSKQLDFRFEISNPADNQGNIPPTILLIFIENCFKHYNKGTAEQKLIHINIEIEDNAIILKTANTFKLNSKNEDNFEKQLGGLGLASAKEKLDLIYKNRYHLEQDVAGNVFKLKLQIPLIH